MLPADGRGPPRPLDPCPPPPPRLDATRARGPRSLIAIRDLTRRARPRPPACAANGRPDRRSPWRSSGGSAVLAWRRPRPTPRRRPRRARRCDRASPAFERLGGRHRGHVRDLRRARIHRRAGVPREQSRPSRHRGQVRGRRPPIVARRDRPERSTRAADRPGPRLAGEERLAPARSWRRPHESPPAERPCRDDGCRAPAAWVSGPSLVSAARRADRRGLVPDTQSRHGSKTTDYVARHGWIGQVVTGRVACRESSDDQSSFDWLANVA